MIPAMKRLLFFAVIMISSVTFVYFAAHERIYQQQQQSLLHTFKEIAPNVDFPTDFLAQNEIFKINELTGKIYRLPEFIFVESSTMSGYSGEIKLLIALDKNQVLGVRVLAHKETPSLGDKIELSKSNWITNFNGTNEKTRFAVKKDGGDFDAFTGATITPRAVVSHVGAIFEVRNELLKGK